MREMCPRCDRGMRLVKPSRPDPDLLVWVCDNPTCARRGEWVIEPNWGKWIPAPRLTPNEIEDLCKPAEYKTSRRD